MAAQSDAVATLSNPLVTVDQLSTSSSQLDGISPDLEASLRFAGSRLTQAAGVLLRLPQEVIVQAVIIFCRFYVGPEAGSFKINALQDVSSASLYLTAKLSFQPTSPRSILNVYKYLFASPSAFRPNAVGSTRPNPEDYYLSEGSYLTAKNVLFQTETVILRALGFAINVITPHHLALTYLQTLSMLPQRPSEKSTRLASRTIQYLNTALLSPQMLYLTHQPSALATSAIYLAAREIGLPISSAEWWEVFDVDREELGFLAVGLLSCEEWIRQEEAKWGKQACPTTLEGLEQEIRRRHRES